MDSHMKGLSSFVDSEERIATLILFYLKKHPEAKDTLEGIAEWWIEKQLVETSVESVALALSRLCHEGLVTEEKMAGENNFYKFNTEFEFEREDVS